MPESSVLQSSVKLPIVLKGGLVVRQSLFAQVSGLDRILTCPNRT